MFNVIRKQQYCGSDVYLQIFEFMNGSDRVCGNFYSGPIVEEPLPSIFMVRDGKTIDLPLMDDIRVTNFKEELQNAYLEYLQENGEIEPVNRISAALAKVGGRNPAYDGPVGVLDGYGEYEDD
jgi:hypothetical protein